MLTPSYLTTSQSEQCPRVDHIQLLQHKTPQYPLLGGSYNLEGTGLPGLPLPGKAMKLFLPTSPQTPALRFNLTPVHWSQILAALKPHMNTKWNASCYSLGKFWHIIEAQETRIKRCYSHTQKGGCFGV